MNELDRLIFEDTRFTHGMHKTRTYKTWGKMKSRCRDANNDSYYLYGGRGIYLCEKWNTFLGFLEDMGERPEGRTLDRINNNDGYHKDNCRWATPLEQVLNRRRIKGKLFPTGVSFYPKYKNSYMARIRIQGKTFFIGSFSSASKARRQYEIFYKEWYGFNPPLDELH